MSEDFAGISGLQTRRVASLPSKLPGATAVGPFSSAIPGALMRVVPGVGRFLARDGSTIDYCVEEGVEPGAVEAVLQGGVLGALIHQRGELPLHASTLLSPDRQIAVAIAGDSGAGKSTTAYELITRGWMMLSDDLTRVTIQEATPLAWPGRSRLRLLEDACDAFGLDTCDLEPAPNWPGKYVVRLNRWEQPATLSGLVVLERTEGAFRIEPLLGADAARVIFRQTYRPHYVAALGQSRRHLELVAATGARAWVLRTSGRASVAQVASAIAAEAMRGIDRT